MLYNTISSRIETPNIISTIENWEVSADHWGGGEEINRLSHLIENALYETSSEEELSAAVKNIFYDICDTNTLIKSIHFFEGNKYLIVSSTRRFKAENYLKRKLIFEYPKKGVSFSFYEITDSEREYHGELPPDWIPLLEEDSEFNKIKQFFID